MTWNRPSLAQCGSLVQAPLPARGVQEERAAAARRKRMDQVPTQGPGAPSSPAPPAASAWRLPSASPPTAPKWSSPISMPTQQRRGRHSGRAFRPGRLGEARRFPHAHRPGPGRVRHGAHPGQQRRLPARRDHRGFSRGRVGQDAGGDADRAVPADQVRLAGDAKQRWGRIINISSIHGLQDLSGKARHGAIPNSGCKRASRSSLGSLASSFTAA